MEHQLELAGVMDYGVAVLLLVNVCQQLHACIIMCMDQEVLSSTQYSSTVYLANCFRPISAY